MHQSQQWGGDAGDDNNSSLDWIKFIDRQMGKLMHEGQQARDDNQYHEIIKSRLVKIAALSIAGIQSIERRKDDQVQV